MRQRVGAIEYLERGAWVPRHTAANGERCKRLHLLLYHLDTTLVRRIQLHHALLEEVRAPQLRDNGLSQLREAANGRGLLTCLATASTVVVFPVPGGP